MPSKTSNFNYDTAQGGVRSRSRSNKKSFDRNRFDGYIANKNQKLKDLKTITENEELKELTLTPDINPKSYKLLDIKGGLKAQPRKVMASIDITSKANFNKVIKKTETLLIIEFVAQWCGPC